MNWLSGSVGTMQANQRSNLVAKTIHLTNSARATLTRSTSTTELVAYRDIAELRSEATILAALGAEMLWRTRGDESGCARAIQ